MFLDSLQYYGMLLGRQCEDNGVQCRYEGQSNLCRKKFMLKYYFRGSTSYRYDHYFFAFSAVEWASLPGASLVPSREGNTMTFTMRELRHSNLE